VADPGAAWAAGAPGRGDRTGRDHRRLHGQPSALRGAAQRWTDRPAAVSAVVRLDSWLLGGWAPQPAGRPWSLRSTAIRCGTMAPRRAPTALEGVIAHGTGVGTEGHRLQPQGAPRLHHPRCLRGRSGPDRDRGEGSAGRPRLPDRCLRTGVRRRDLPTWDAYP